MRRLLPALALILLLPAQAVADADVSTLNGKVLVGYQGWFRCPGDGSGLDFAKGRWVRPAPGPNGDQPGKRQWLVDMLPDVSGMEASSVCTVTGQTRGGQPIHVFTSFAPATAQTHFRWMRDHDIDGALVQRFLVHQGRYKSENDQVLKNILRAAADNGRVFAIEYDVTDYKGDVFAALKADWTYLERDLSLTRQPGYQKHAGKPVVSLWGFGFGDGRHVSDPDVARRIIEWFKRRGVRVMGGVPAGWNRLGGDSVSDPRWQKVYAAFDIVQPWTVGRYKSLTDIPALAAPAYRQDMKVTSINRQAYMPVIYPGFSWHSTHPDYKSNQIPRLSGDFLWQQALSARQAGAKMVKIAMFDEVNEGTALLPVIAKQADAPQDGVWVTRDADGTSLAPDHYLQLAGRIGALFKVP